ncbi:hypothetical protein IAU60_000128 [Kwoniella sp. DSM 27419]
MPPSSHHHASRFPTFGKGGRPATKLELDALPSMDKMAYYDVPLSPSSDNSDLSLDVPPRNLMSNSGNKLDPSARFMRRGKMFAWGPQYEDSKAEQLTRKRLELCLQQLYPEAAAEVGSLVPPNLVDGAARRKERKRKRIEEDFTLPHLRSPSPPATTTKLAPMLALPRNYVDILMSPAMRHTLGDDGMETGLQSTAGELLEGEKPLMQALGRLKDIVRLLNKDVKSTIALPRLDPEAIEGDDSKTPSVLLNIDAARGDPGMIPPLPHISDIDNLWRVTQELLGGPGNQSSVPPPTITFTASNPSQVSTSTNPASPEVPQPVPTPLQRLFTCPEGITLHAVPNPAHPGHRYPKGHAHRPSVIKYNLDMTNQCRAVDDALERIAELLADCNEYKERLEEARDRVADVARARKKVWSVVKERGGRELDIQEGDKDA